MSFPASNMKRCLTKVSSLVYISTILDEGTDNINVSFKRPRVQRCVVAIIAGLYVALLEQHQFSDNIHVACSSSNMYSCSTISVSGVDRCIIIIK